MADPVLAVAKVGGSLAYSVIQTSLFSIFLVLTFLAAALSFSVSLINTVQNNSNNNNNNNNNNNMNMNMNTNMNSRKRSLMMQPIPYRVKRWDQIFNLVELPNGKFGNRSFTYLYHAGKTGKNRVQPCSAVILALS